MKKLVVFFIILSSLFSLTSCTARYIRSDKGNLTFYYLKSAPQYNTVDGMICAETQKAEKNFSDEEWIQLINLYLKGPNCNKLISPFPEETTLKRFSVNGDNLTLFLSNQISELEGYDLTLACACLTQTVLELKPVNSVEIRAEGGRMGDFISITMSKESLLLLDTEKG